MDNKLSQAYPRMKLTTPQWYWNTINGYMDQSPILKMSATIKFNWKEGHSMKLVKEQKSADWIHVFHRISFLYIC